MRILLAGGGSGGHVTPLKAIARQLRLQKGTVELYVITDRSFYGRAQEIFADMADVRIKRIFAGKLRRYHSKSLFWHAVHLPTLLKNIRDLIYIALGTIQSLWLLIRTRPDVVFCKGGFVCVPVGYVAHLFKIPIIIHDSDTKPGLTNRMLSRFARTIATGMPAEFYPYEPSKMVYSGMPVENAYQPQSKKQQDEHKSALGFEPSRPVLLLTGGGNGSIPLNEILSRGAGELLKQGWGVIHLAGKGKVGAVEAVRGQLPKNLQQNWHIEEFAQMAPRLLAADIIVARTSANTLQECANAQKAVIGVPSPHLADQNMNAEYFNSKNALVVLAESSLDEPSTLVSAVSELFENQDKAKSLAKTLHDNFAKPDAAKELAKLILATKN
jgi:UDP-N-acetylglucosamine--N-acetylmuramyl-(pentapeptide) pyrophosphoryl-undecaprenol N-acetylglucosamine transferase